MAITYERVNWDTTKYVNPSNMNQMDEGIKDACDGVDNLNTEVDEKIGDMSTLPDPASDLCTNISEVNSNLAIESNSVVLTTNTSVVDTVVSTSSYKIGKILTTNITFKLKSGLSGNTEYQMGTINKTLISRTNGHINYTGNTKTVGGFVVSGNRLFINLTETSTSEMTLTFTGIVQ